MDLRSRWLDLCKRIGFRGDAEAVFNDLLARYREKQRRYHTDKHWEAGLIEFDLLRDLAQYPDYLEFAYGFHDSVYAPRGKDNEEESATLAMSTLSAGRLHAGVQAIVGDLIMVTKPGINPVTIDQRIMVDIDRAILGKPRPIFIAYESEVREEYHEVPEEIFWEARKNILRIFLEQDSIFFTERFRERYEDQAIKNLEWTIAVH